MSVDWLAVGGLFLSAFGAATLLPMQSEIVLAAMLAAGVASPKVLFVVASVGNTLGSLLNYVMGRWLERGQGSAWFPATGEQMARARAWYARWGVWSLLVSWAPFTDVLTVVAGTLRTPLWRFLILVGIAKSGRYAGIVWVCERVSWC